MAAKALPFLACPCCGHALDHMGDTMVCGASTCGASFPVEDGIPNFSGIAVKRDSDRKRSKLKALLARTIVWVDRTLSAPESLIFKVSPFSPLHYSAHRFMLAEAAKIPQGARVLDIGAGTKPYKAQLEKRGEYFSTDIVSSSGNKAGTLGETQDFVSRADSLPVAAAQFDVAVLTDVLEHVPEPAAVMAEVARVLKPGGYCILTVPMMVGEHQQPWHFQNFTQFGLRYIADKVGLTVETLKPRGRYGSVLASLIRFFPGSLFPFSTNPARLALRVIPYALSPLTSIVLPGIFILTDAFDRKRSYTLGYCAIMRKEAGGCQA